MRAQLAAQAPSASHRTDVLDELSDLLNIRDMNESGSVINVSASTKPYQYADTHMVASSLMCQPLSVDEGCH